MREIRNTGHGVRHGLLAESVVADGESVRRFQALLGALRDHFRPMNVAEANLVDTMAVAHWRQMRLWAVEKARLNLETGKPVADAGESEAASRDAATRMAMAFESISDGTRAMDVITRYELNYDRQYSRALNNLMKMRKKAA